MSNTANVTVTIKNNTPFVPAGRYYLFSEPASWTLMPTDENSGQLPITLDKDRCTLTAEAVSGAPDDTQGLLRVYKVRPIALTLVFENGAKAELTVSYRAENLAVLHTWGLDCRSAGEPKNPPERSFLVKVTDGGELLSKGKLEVWRAGDMLCFFRRDRNLYTGKENLYTGELPVQAIRFYRLCGGMRTETRVSGGGVTVDRSAAYWAGWEHPFSFNPHGRAIEAAVQSEPIRTEEVQHDERYVQLRVQWKNKRVDLRFSPDSLSAFDALIPEREFDEVALSDREPTPVEQLDLLAGLCERGFVTREEFEQAKVRLLGKI